MFSVDLLVYRPRQNRNSIAGNVGIVIIPPSLFSTSSVLLSLLTVYKALSWSCIISLYQWYDTALLSGKIEFMNGEMELLNWGDSVFCSYAIVQVPSTMIDSLLLGLYNTQGTFFYRRFEDYVPFPAKRSDNERATFWGLARPKTYKVQSTSFFLPNSRSHENMSFPPF